MDIEWNSTREDMILEWDWREIRELCDRYTKGMIRKETRFYGDVSNVLKIKHLILVFSRH